MDMGFFNNPCKKNEKCGDDGCKGKCSEGSCVSDENGVFSCVKNEEETYTKLYMIIGIIVLVLLVLLALYFWKKNGMSKEGSNDDGPVYSGL